MSNSFPLSRRDAIEARLMAGQHVSAASLAQEFDVSEDAVRRDLRTLAAEGKCRRVYGGALPMPASARPMMVRLNDTSEQKESLAKTAAAMIQPGELLFLDSSSSNLALVSYIQPEIGITIATNSLDIASALADRDDIDLLMVGGAVNRHVRGCVDAAALATISTLNIDRCFLGACALSPETGISVHDHADAAFKRALLINSRSCTVLATSEKLRDRAPYRVAAPSDIEYLIVEHTLPVDEAKRLESAGFKLVRAEISPPPSSPL